MELADPTNKPNNTGQQSSMTDDCLLHSASSFVYNVMGMTVKPRLHHTASNKLN